MKISGSVTLILRQFVVLPALILSGIYCSCQSPAAEGHSGSNSDSSKSISAASSPVAVLGIKPDKAVNILEKKEVPILCYHQIRDWTAKDSKTAKDYIVPVAQFREQMKMLSDSGYHTILPDELYAYLNEGRSLPSKPIMLTFDDTDDDQYQVAVPEMKKYGFKAVFFIMTVSIGRPNYMTAAQVKELADAGNEIGSHTWDHHNVKKYEGKDWEVQIEKPLAQLEKITGKPIRYFAYPFGLWNEAAIPQLKQRGFIAAFQLYAKRDEMDPLYTIRRIIVPGEWSSNTLNKRILSSFASTTRQLALK